MLDYHRFHVGQAPWQDRGPNVTVPPSRVPVRVAARYRDGYVDDIVGWASAWHLADRNCFETNVFGTGGYGLMW